MRKTLKLGSSGEDFKYLVDRLNELQYECPRVNVFDDHVKDAVRDFQSRHVDSAYRPLKIDGVVGPLTWWALEQKDIYSLVAGINRVFESIPPGGSYRGKEALAIAYHEMMNGAQEVGSNNNGPWVVKYLNGAQPPQNWCAAFVSYCFSKTSNSPISYSLGAKRIYNQFERKEWIYNHKTEDPLPGDIVVWHRGDPDSWMGHIGFVFKCVGGVLYTIEGNKGSFPAPVKIFHYTFQNMKRLLGFGRVDYA